MTGRIENLTTASQPGRIHAENGQSVSFSTLAVWEYDLPSLGVGRAVSFELKEGEPTVATNVRIAPEALPTITPKERRGGLHLRYAGFDQEKDVRSYLFQLLPPAEDQKLIVVNAEMSLFVKHHIRIQDGPALCLHALTEAPEPVQLHALNEQDILNYIATRPVPVKRIGAKRGGRPAEATEGSMGHTSEQTPSAWMAKPAL
jgi:hypothetical protein